MFYVDHSKFAMHFIEANEIKFGCKNKLITDKIWQDGVKKERFLLFTIKVKRKKFPIAVQFAVLKNAQQTKFCEREHLERNRQIF